MKNSIDELKEKIRSNWFSNRDQHIKWCDEILKLALEDNDSDAIAFSYLWQAEYYYYEKNDAKKLTEYLGKASQYLSKVPSEDLIQYYTLKALEDNCTFDLLSRLSAYLEIIKVSEKLGKEENIASAYGNIADLFRMCHDYETALLYSENVYRDNKIENRTIIIILITNIVELLYYLNRPEEILTYIHKIEEIHHGNSANSILLDTCYLRYYSLCNRQDETMKVYKQMFEKVKTIPTNRGFLYDFLLSMFEAMLYIQNADEMKSILDYYETLFNEDDTNQWLGIQNMKIKYYSMISDEVNLKTCYKMYIKAYERVEEESKYVKIEGVRARVEVMNIAKHEKDLKADNSDLENESLVDIITQLYNRRYFNNFLKNSKNKQTMKQIGFAIFDVDYFKEYNDSYGHLMGDNVLFQISSILKEKAEERIHPCRFGGDEFVCIFENMSIDEVEKYVQCVMSELSKKAIPHLHSKCSNIVTLSIGFGVEEISENEKENALLAKVDEALYLSKQKGRNAYTIYKDGGEKYG